MSMRAQRGVGGTAPTHLQTGLEGGGWQVPGYGRFTPRKTWYPFYRKWVGHRTGLDVTEGLTPPGFNLWTVQPTASHYTDYTTPRII
jgi:hypothetical protein